MAGWAEQQIIDAQRQGEYDNLPGKGKPLPGLDGNRDDMWWLKDKLKREQLDLSPPTIVMRRKVELWWDAIETFETEDRVLREAAQLNCEIVKANATELGPLSPQPLIDIQDASARWRAKRKPS